MIRFRQAIAFGSPSRHRKTSSRRTPTTTTGTSPTRTVCPTAPPDGKNAAAASAPRRQTGEPAASSVDEKARPSSTS